MFEIESCKNDELTIKTGKATIVFDMVKGEIDAGLELGRLSGPGEFEVGEATIRGVDTSAGTIYDVMIGGVKLGILGGIEQELDELGMVDILVTSSIRAVRELNPKLVLATGNVDGLVTELKLTARVEKKLKIKNIEALPPSLEVVVLN